MPSRLDIIGPIDLEVTDTFNIVVPDGTDEARFQATIQSGTWDAAELEVEWSLNGSAWAALDEPLTLTSAEEDVISTPRYLGAVRLLRIRVATNQSGTAGVAEITIASESTHLGALRWRSG